MATQENQEPQQAHSNADDWDGLGQGRTIVLIALFVVGAALSGLLQFDHHGISSAGAVVDQLCGEGAESGCDQVARSPYSSIGGVSVAAVGSFFYAALILLACLSLPASKEVRRAAAVMLLYLTALALGVDIVLLGLQAFVIGAYCKLCVATYGVTGAALVLLLEAKEAIPAASAAWRKPAGQATLAAWGLGCVAALVSVGTAEYVLGSDAANREAAIVDALSGDNFVEAEPEPAPESATLKKPTKPLPSPAATPRVSSDNSLRPAPSRAACAKSSTTTKNISSIGWTGRPRSSSKLLDNKWISRGFPPRG